MGIFPKYRVKIKMFETTTQQPYDALEHVNLRLQNIFGIFPSSNFSGGICGLSGPELWDTQIATCTQKIGSPKNPWTLQWVRVKEPVLRRGPTPQNSNFWKILREKSFLFCEGRRGSINHINPSETTRDTLDNTFQQKCFFSRTWSIIPVDVSG